MGWIILATYVIGLVATARWLAPRILDLYDHKDNKPDVADIVIARVVALLIGAFWPVTLLGALVFWDAPKSQGQLKHELADRERRIRELELGFASKK